MKHEMWFCQRPWRLGEQSMRRVWLSWTRGLLVAGLVGLPAIAGATGAKGAGQLSPDLESCILKPESGFTVTRISGPQSMHLDDGSELVLAGVVLPTRLDVNDALPAWPPQQAARRTLQDLLRGKSIALASPSKWPDRYARRRAQVFFEKAGSRIWLQAYLVGLGQARVDVAALTRPCANDLLRLEAVARQAKRGLWRNAAYRIKSAHEPSQLLRYRSSFQIIEGTVAAVAQRRQRSYINFGSNQRRDFTVSFRSKLAAETAQSSPKIAELKGRKVRVRGWVTWRGGPFIEIRSMQQLEVLPSQPVARAPTPRMPASDADLHGQRSPPPPGLIDL
jgi:micrococcal nuclease